MAAEVNVFNNERTPWTEVLVHRADHLPGIGKVGEQEPRVDHIEGFVRFPVADVSCVESDVGNALLCRLASCQIEFDLVKIDANHPTCEFCCAGKFDRHIAATATNIEARASGGNANLSNEITR